MKLYLCLFAVLSALLAFSCGEVKSGYFGDSDNNNPDGGVFTTSCNGELYNASTHFCSGDAVYIRCNGGEYDAETEFCFNKRVYKKCDGKDYDAAKEFCSEINKVYTLCDGEPFKVTSQLCFKGEIKRRCPNSSFEDEFCVVNGKDTTSYRICGTEMYKTKEKFCVVDKNEIWDKCGTKEYDPYKQFCLMVIDSITKPPKKDTTWSYYDLCNGKMLSPINDFCFDGKVYPLCKGETYNTKEKFCYQNVLYPLCNGVEFNPKDYFCSPHDLKAHPYCNGEEYNPKINICNKDADGKDTQYYICPSGNYSKNYSKDHSTCCPNPNPNKIACEEYQICGKTEYNIANKFCEGGNIYDLCNGKTYENPSKNFCGTDKKVHPKCPVISGYNDFGAPQYRDTIYDPDYEFCGSGKIENRTDISPKCEWQDEAEKKAKFCCFGRKYDKISSKSFCYKDELYPICIKKPTYIGTDTTEYDPVYKGCFEGALYPKCTIDSIVGTCVDNTVKRCKQLGSGKDHIVDPLPEMTCNPNGSITGISKAGGYKVAQIGSQVWLAENLKDTLVTIQNQQGQGWTEELKQALIELSPVWPIAILRLYLKANEYNNITTITVNSNNKCYDNISANCSKYGILYDWATSIKLPPGCNYTDETCPPEPALLQPGICPNGFYLPRDEDWQILTDYAGGAAIAGGRLKDTTGWNGNGNGTNSYGFNALPGGSYNEIIAGSTGNGFDGTEGKYTKWWSTTQHPKPDAYYWTIYSSDTELRHFFQSKGSNMAYVRCLLYYKDSK